jgi:hypothetical protein
MQNHKLFDLIVLGSWLFVAILVTIDYNIKNKEPVKTLVFKPNSEVEVENISLAGDNSINVTLKDGSKSKLVLFLPIKANKKKFLEVLSRSSGQKIVFYDKIEGKEVADLKFIFEEEKEVGLKDCLEKP